MKIAKYFLLIALALTVAPLLAGPATRPTTAPINPSDPSATAQNAAQAAALAVVPVQSLSKDRTPHRAPKPGEVLSMQIKELGNFDYDADKGGNVPADVLALDGATVKLTGFMIPVDQAGTITRFALVPSLFACCFGQPPQLQHTILVTCPPNKSVAYYPDQLSVQGKLHVEEKREDGFIVSLFEIDASSVKAEGK